MAIGAGPVGVGIIGAGNISDQYLSNLTTFPDVRVLAIGDLLEERAKAQAEKYGVPRSGGVDTVLGDPEIDIVVNLTIPAVHVEVSEAIIAAGKHVWTEKPIGVDREESRRLLEKADAAGLRVGVAPDTVLGPGVQTAKRAIARGDIGRPLFAQTTFQWSGPEIFHPNPAFLYAKGAGPLLDMGPYYVSALVHVFGPVASVAALGLQGTPTRRVQVGELAGQEFPVEIPSTLSVLMDFEQGGQAQSVYSTDSPVIRQGIVEITGTEGTIVIPDPNTFGGAISITHRSRACSSRRSRSSRRSSTSSRRACSPVAAWDCSTWRARSPPAVRTWPRESSATTCSTRCCRSRRPRNRAASSRSRARSIRSAPSPVTSTRSRPPSDRPSWRRRRGSTRLRRHGVDQAAGSRKRTSRSCPVSSSSAMSSRDFRKSENER